MRNNSMSGYPVTSETWSLLLGVHEFSLFFSTSNGKSVFLLCHRSLFCCCFAVFLASLLGVVVC